MTASAARPGPPTADAPLKRAAYDRFQEALLKGRLRAGELVSQKELVALLDMSIGALRELLPRLEAEGLVTVMPKRGIQITVIDLPMIRDAFQMRAALEREAVMSAIQTFSDETIERQERKHRAILARLEAEEGSETAILAEGQRIDGAFHDLMIAATGNDLLIHAYRVNATRIRLIKLDRIKLTRLTLPSAFADHLAVIEALKARDGAAAAAALDAHIRSARDRATQL